MDQDQELPESLEELEDRLRRRETLTIVAAADGLVYQLYLAREY